MTSLGMPVIYYGEEVARGGHEWPLNRNDMPWGERPIRPGGGVARDEALRAYYQALIRIRREHPALTRGDFTLLSGPQDPLLAFARADAASGDRVVVLVNRDDQGAQADYPLPPGWPAGAAARDALTGDAATLAEGRLRIALRPKSARVIVAAPAPGS
jgi:alpha-amylase